MREKQMERHRPPTPSVPIAKPSTPQRPSSAQNTNEFDSPGDEMNSRDPGVTIEVKPLPKIRLSLMPAPREEDEDETSSASQPAPPVVVKKKRNKSFRRNSSGPMSTRSYTQ